MEKFGQETKNYTFSHDINQNMNQDTTFINPFNDIKVPSSSHNPFEPFIRRDEHGHLFEEDIEVVAQTIEVASFVGDFVLHDANQYLPILLHQGVKFPCGFDINTLRATSPTHDSNNNNANNASYTSQPQNNAKITLVGVSSQISTSTINATSNDTSNQNTFNKINAISIRGTPTMSQAMS